MELVEAIKTSLKVQGQSCADMGVGGVYVVTNEGVHEAGEEMG